MLCRELLGLQPRQGAGISGGAVLSKDDRVKQILDEILEKLPDEFPLVEICSRLEEKTPFMVVIVQECERVNGLLIEAKRSLRELDKGLKVHIWNYTLAICSTSSHKLVFFSTPKRASCP